MSAIFHNEKVLSECVYNVRKVIHQNVATTFEVRVSVNAIVHIFQIFYREHIFLFIFYVVSSWETIFTPTPKLICFLIKDAWC